MKKLLTAIVCLLPIWILAQNGTIRGNVYDKETGEPVGLATVYLDGTTQGTSTDLNGFYTITAKAGTYVLKVNFLGYTTSQVEIKLNPGAVVNQQFYLAPEGIELETVKVSAERQEAKNEVKVSSVTVSSKQIKALPSAGGEADIVQYLTVLPGIVSSGDQGGQLFIRGGAPIQNKILLDGMTIYNPFHSIGFFSVFETETIRSVDVYTGGFNAEYGGRVSAIVDIKTREGNKKRFSGLVSASPFQAKALIEGPIVKLKENGGNSVSFLLTGKHSYLNKTSPKIYNWLSDSLGLPFSFTDFYGKLSVVTDNGSRVNFFGFNFNDNVNYTNLADLNWKSSGGGMNFSLVPNAAQMVFGGQVGYSNYDITLIEADGRPRTSNANGFNINLDFTYFNDDDELKYGLEVSGFNTNFEFINPFNQTFKITSYNTELAGFVKYRLKAGKLILEPSFRAMYYASLPEFSPEPRLGVKYQLSDRLRLKGAAGMYSQNLLSTVNERDIVNLFVGFLTGPDQTIYQPDGVTKATTRLQKAWHAVAGVEYDLGKNIQLNLEPYYKDFTQLIELNRNKTNAQEPDYATETGVAYGIDFSLKYESPRWYVWTAYSISKVTRDDGDQIYPPNFDRRHNLNTVVTYSFGKNRSWELSGRWNFGTGFPFTLTQGFYQNFDFSNGINSDFLTGNGGLGIIYDEKRNSGRLPTYHRLDLSLKKTWEFSKYSKVELVASVTNAYDRQNIFYFDRVRYKRVNQLPILPSLGMTVSL